jgi:uncharacterized protein YjbI with pentapeptide repeats
MANPEHLAKLNEGVPAWNAWRKQNPELAPDISETDLSEMPLEGIDFSRTNLIKVNLRCRDLRSAKLVMATLNLADLTEADLSGVDLSAAWLRTTKMHGANLQRARLAGAQLTQAALERADLTESNLFTANLSRANLREAILNKAQLTLADLIMVDLSRATMRSASLYRANLHLANLADADLSDAQLSLANLVQTNFERANLTGCGVYGVSAWDVRLEGATQSNLIITPDHVPLIQVDNLEVAQFIYLLLNNERIRHVIDTITSKVVLILGRFTEERKRVLDAIRVELRRCNYLPVLFDFSKPDSKDLTGTVSTLAHLARFIIADLTDPSCIPYELATVVQTCVPIQTIILEGKHEFAMFRDLLKYRWVLPPFKYESEEILLANLNERVIAPAEAKVAELREHFSGPVETL